MSSSGRRASILDTLAAGIARLTSSEDWKGWLDMQSRFHRYSFGNVLLIEAQRPDATRVAGFHAWRRLGRHVRKGERAIWILAPLRRRVAVQSDHADDTPEVSRVLAGFRATAVFDIRQTEGDELSATPVRKLAGGDPDALYVRLSGVADALGFSVEEDHLDAGRNGDCNHVTNRIRIEERNEPLHRVKTLAHELAHAVLHPAGYLDTPRPEAELEAESTAYVVCSALGLDAGEYSFGYVAAWIGGGDEAIAAIKASGHRIQRAAAELIGLLGLDEVGVVTGDAEAA
jgi:antirestriction protein ArdC